MVTILKEETKETLRKELTYLIKKAREPNVSPVQLSIFIGIVIWLVVSNSNLFGATILSVCISIASYFFIMALRGKIGGTYADLLRTIFEILCNGGSDAEKVAKMENILIMAANWLGEHYEKEIDKLINYCKEKKHLI